MAVSKRLRYEILRRDNHACRYCGATAPDAALTVDHVVPVALGGSDDPSNLVAACKDCNAGKSASNPDGPIVANVADDALRWAAAMQRAAKNAEADRQARYKLAEDFSDYWDTMADRWTRIPDDWEQTVYRFRDLGLTLAALLEASNIAITKRGIQRPDRWRYFCGTCWSMITELQEAARAELSGAV